MVNGVNHRLARHLLFSTRLLMLNREIRPSLYCVEIRTNNWQRMVDWYRHTLGLRVLMRVTDDGYALIEAGETRIALLDRELASEPNGRWSMGRSRTGW